MREVKIIVELSEKHLIGIYNNFSFQFSIVYFEPDGDQKYAFNSKPKLVTVPDTEILQVNRNYEAIRKRRDSVIGMNRIS